MATNRAASLSPARAAMTASLYCDAYTPKNRYHQVKTPRLAIAVSHVQCGIDATPIMANPVLTMVHGWHHGGLMSHTLSGTSLKNSSGSDDVDVSPSSPS
eukprot:CAMPEP_0198713052 /NCGR_PEP_ID=MMETSP1471-20131121/4651_2 /TAXON_ID=41880 /ORGANISM="Pycnococcus provasolii, Strain RCC733" /LENGTH=99 /DNA_ID=CAMNT_0044473063 /DNA_START=61 /DNA_END=363 /DNA_ORIENTATION=-